MSDLESEQQVSNHGEDEQVEKEPDCRDDFRCVFSLRT